MILIRGARRLVHTAGPALLVLLAAVWLLGQSVRGTVTDRSTAAECRRGTCELVVHPPSGEVTTIEVTPGERDRCRVRSVYPECREGGR